MELLNIAAKLVGGKPWGADKGKPRIYMPSSKDRKIYFDFPDFTSASLGGASFRCFIDDCGQPGAWYASQKQIEINRHQRQSLALMAFEENYKLAAEILTTDAPFDVDEMASHLANGRYHDAARLMSYRAKPTKTR